MLTEIPRGFQRVALELGFSVELLTIIHRTFEVRNLVVKAASQPLNADELMYLHKYRPENEFHEAFKYLQHLQFTSTTLEHCICFALVVFTNLTFNVMRYGVLWQQVRESLTHAVLNCRESSTYGAYGLMWSMMMAICSWTGRLGLEPNGERVLADMQDRFPITSTWNDAQAILREFLLTPELDEQLSKCWA